MEVRQIYFDMDGVLADFDRGVRELCGMETPDQGAHSPEQDDLMWERIRNADHFYDRLELMPGAKELFDAVYGKYGDRCEILTGIPKDTKFLMGEGHFGSDAWGIFAKSVSMNARERVVMYKFERKGIKLPE